MTKKILLLLFFLTLNLLTYAQQIGVGTNTPHPSAIMDLSPNDKALMVTRVANVSAIPSPVNGMIVYDLSLNCFRGYQNGSWSDCGFLNISNGLASASPSVCINEPIPVITHVTSGATGIGVATGLPTGVTAIWSNSIITISGTPSVSGVFNYSIPLLGGVLPVFATGTITVSSMAVTEASSTPTLCVNSNLNTITHTTTGANGIGTPNGLPAGVIASWDSNTITINGTPSESGVFNYSIPLTGGCGLVNATGTITVTSNLSATSVSSSPLCINTFSTATIHTTAGATGIGIVTGLPSGVTASWIDNTIAISGSPTVSGTFYYSIPLLGNCGNAVSATGTIIVQPSMTVTSASSSPTLCINTALTAITHTTTRATGIGTPSGLPAGVSATWASNVITISGIPTASGTFNYSIPLTGGCGTVSAIGTISVTPNMSVTSGTSRTLCMNTALTAITHTTSRATGIGTPTGLPAGVSASWASNIITISGTPTESGIFNYSIPLVGGCGVINATGTITVNNRSVTAASSSPTLCINTALTPISHTTTVATGIGAATGLPTGVSAAWASNTLTISGTPTVSGVFNYSIPITGGTCGSAVNATGTITVNPNNTVTVASSSPTLCINTALTAITHTTTGATGIGTATGLPAGVTASWASNVITISGTPTASGTFNYSIPLTGSCGTVNATGTITVNPNNTVTVASSSPTLCINTALTAITHTTTHATGIGTPTGLPTGVSASWASNVITISGTPTASGTFNYSIPLTGGCGTVSATGTITVNPNRSVSVASSSPNLCINTALTAITHTTTGVTGIGTATGLPSGVSASWTNNTITISGTPTVSGTFNYSIPLTGTCGSAVNATGTITVTPIMTVTAASSSPTLCINTSLTAITHTTTRATGIGTPTGLPTGVSASWASNVITISGTPTVSGTFNYSIPLTGGCGTVSATGTITVNPNRSVSVASSSPTLCINTALTAITHTTTGATGIGTATGLPSGVSASWANNTITISGTPTVSGTFNYSIPLTGTCGSAVNATGTITVTPNLAVTAASSTPTLCINTVLTPITHTTTGATGIGTVTGLPAGVSASWASNIITISGTPTQSGVFTYIIPLLGGICGNSAVNAKGIIIVNPNMRTSAASSTPTLCINSSLSDVYHYTIGVTGIGTATGLPPGVNAFWDSLLMRIRLNGTPTQAGLFNYSIPLTGGCDVVNATGVITVIPNKAVSAASSSPTLCINTVLTPITHTTTGVTSIGSLGGLPTGVIPSLEGNILTISGTPTESGTFNYNLTLLGECGSNAANATGTITVTPNMTVTSGTTQILCINTALTAITHTTARATGIGTPSGLPSGVSALWASNTITISGTPTESGTFNYSIPLTGGCGTVNATGTITVLSNNTVSVASSTPALCINTALSPITHTTTGATGIGTPLGLPSGVTASWANNTITISGSPSVGGTFNYSIPLTGGCSTVSATGTITSYRTVAIVSNPTVTINSYMSRVTHVTEGFVTGIGSPTGLPSGVSASWVNNTITLSGTPSVAGTYNYTIPIIGGCDATFTTGTLTVVNCGAFVSAGVYKVFACHNLGANTSLDPNIPAQGLHGNYYQWGRSTVVANASTASGAISGWNTSTVATNSWQDGTKTANDPCPTGFRVPSRADWQGVIANNTATRTGSWGTDNFTSAIHFGPDSNTFTLSLPAAGYRDRTNGALFGRGTGALYWSSTNNNSTTSFNFTAGSTTVNSASTSLFNMGYSVRCISQ